MYRPQIAVVDSGVDQKNREIMQHVVQGFSFTQDTRKNIIVESDDYDDTFGHGTNCIDCILQLAELAQFYPIRIVNKSGKTTSELLLEALGKCKDLSVDIICLSLSVTRLLDPMIDHELEKVCRELEAQGKLICASECNNIKNTIPAVYGSVIGVGELPYNAEKKIIVDRNKKIQVKADILPIFVAGKRGRYNFFKGTSKSNAYIAGILARAMQVENGLDSVEKALEILENVEETPENLETQNVGMLQTDELGQVVLEKIRNNLWKFGCDASLDEICKYPFLSEVTGINFFNFYDFIKELYIDLKITEPDYHEIKIGDVCILYNLVEYLKRKVRYEKKECGIGADKKL